MKWVVDIIGKQDKLGTGPMAIGGIDGSRRGKREEGGEPDPFCVWRLSGLTWDETAEPAW